MSEPLDHGHPTAGFVQYPCLYITFPLGSPSPFWFPSTRTDSCSSRNIKHITEWEGGTLGWWDTRPFAGDLQWCRSNTDNQGTPAGHPLFTLFPDLHSNSAFNSSARAPSPDSWPEPVIQELHRSPSRYCWMHRPHTRHSSPARTEIVQLPAKQDGGRHPVGRRDPDRKLGVWQLDAGRWETSGCRGTGWGKRTIRKPWHWIQKSSPWGNSQKPFYQSEGQRLVAKLNCPPQNSHSLRGLLYIPHFKWVFTDYTGCFPVHFSYEHSLVLFICWRRVLCFVKSHNFRFLNKDTISMCQ